MLVQAVSAQQGTPRAAESRSPQHSFTKLARPDAATGPCTTTGRQTFSAGELHDIADAIERYCYYVEVGISTKNIAPFRQAWIENVLSLLPPHRPAHLPEDYYQQLLEEAVDEMKADYVYSMRKAIMQYILRSSVERRCASGTCFLPTWTGAPVCLHPHD